MKKTYVLETIVSAENAEALVPHLLVDLNRQVPAGHVVVHERSGHVEMFNPDSPVKVQVFYREAN